MSSAAPVAASDECVLMFRKQLQQMADADYLRCLVAYHAAPVVQGIKPAALVCPGRESDRLTRALHQCGKAVGAALGVEIAQLHNRNGALLLLAYNPALVRNILAMGETATLLNESGFVSPMACIEDLLEQLRERCRGCSFPHEIGVLLGYPVSDVRGFMNGDRRNDGTPCCWRSYGDYEEARQRSARIRAAKLLAAGLLAGGADIGEVVTALRTSA